MAISVLIAVAAALIGGCFVLIAIVGLARPGRTGRIAVGLVLAGVVASTVVGGLSPHWLSPTHWRWWYRLTMTGLPVLLYVSLALLLAWAGRGLWSLARRRSRRRPPTTSRSAPPSRAGRILVVLAVSCGLGVTGWGYAVSLHPVIRPVTIVSQRLPADFDGYTIALLTDLHLGPTIDERYLRQVVDQVNAAQPDLIVIAGDVIDGTPAQLGPELTALTELSAPDGVVVTTGNHELRFGVKAWIAYFRQLGLTVLDNDGLELARGASSIDLLGINDRQATGAYAPDLRLAAERLHQASGVPVDGTGRYRILIAHEPRQARDDDDLAASLGVDLQLSGHTHAGQFWPLGYYQDLVQGGSQGVRVIGGVTVVISAGLGSSISPVRVDATAEIPLITLTSA